MQNHTSPHKEDSHLSLLRRIEDNQVHNDSQQGEWDMEMGQPGTVQELKKKFDSGIVAPQEGAAGWKKSEEDPRSVKDAQLPGKLIRGGSVESAAESLVEELAESGGRIRTLTQENVELKGEVTALREAKDRAEKEAMYWKEENAKQQEAAQQEMDHFRKEEARHRQECVDNWEGRVKEMQAQITSQEQEKKQLREKSNKLQNELQRMTKDLAKCKEDARQLEMENAHQRQEKVKCGEKEKRLREQIHAKDTQLGEVKRLYQEEIRKVKAAEEVMMKLMKKDLRNQEELAALR
ncbi:uncharacterized protein LOC126986316 [Eriocheir sinensis]|uniref:uncharacterized protein LOC126986316 n=1 Tax=Eriocheir sinensis TaxID=95602 RepID=UPI0021C95C4D|nr:uncharacterized protein LOC126986316 [Eriocheir sinensis]